MSNEDYILIPKKIAKGLGELNQDELGVFFKQFLYCLGFSDEQPKVDVPNTGGLTCFVVLDPLLRKVNGLVDEE